MKKLATKKKIAVKEPVSNPVKATVKVIGRTYEATGDTVREAISNLKPGNCKGRSILTVERGGIKKERIMMPSLTLRLFNTSGVSREIALKNASLLFDGI